MARAHDRAERLRAERRFEWRTWLDTHYTRPDGVWLVSWKAHTGKPALTHDEAVE